MRRPILRRQLECGWMAGEPRGDVRCGGVKSDYGAGERCVGGDLNSPTAISVKIALNTPATVSFPTPFLPQKLYLPRMASSSSSTSVAVAIIAITVSTASTAIVPVAATPSTVIASVTVVVATSTASASASTASLVAQLDLGTHTADAGTVQPTHGIVSVPGVLEFDEGEARRTTSHPHFADATVASERLLQLKREES